MESAHHMRTGNAVVAVLGLLLLVTVYSSTMIASLPTNTGGETPLRMSDIDGPRIDDAAAMIVVDDAGMDTVTPTLSRAVFFFLFLAYVALIIFNFSYTFGRVTSPQWFWETLYTAFAIWGWSVVDPEMIHRWFPILVLQSGLIIFAAYLYLLEKRELSEIEAASLE